MNNSNDKTTWVSANDFIASQTKAIEEQFGCSQPKPRNRAMGFRGRSERRRGRNACPKCGKRLVDPFTLKIEHDWVECGKL